MKDLFTPVVTRYREMQKSIPSAKIFKGGQLMIIDPGHGGLNAKGEYLTKGKQAEHEEFTFLEGVWNRAVAWTLAHEMYCSQRSYAIIAAEDTDVSLTNRVKRAATLLQIAPSSINPYLLSIHGNAFSEESVNGVEAYTSPGFTKADPLAAIVLNELSKLGWRMRLNGRELDKEARFTMVTGPEKAGIPAILAEIGFYTNLEQTKEMCQTRTIDLIAQFLRNADVRIDYLNLLR